MDNGTFLRTSRHHMVAPAEWKLEKDCEWARVLLCHANRRSQGAEVRNISQCEES